MEALLALFGLGLLLLVVLAPILAIVALVRTSRLETEIRNARADLGLMETRVSALGKLVSAERAGRASTEAAPAPEPAPVPIVTPPTPPPAAIAPPAPMPTPVPAPVRVPVAARTSVEPPRELPPPRPPRPEPPAEPPPPAPGSSFDWESLLGLKGAAWLGGIALVIAAAFFAKWTIDQGYVTPQLRIAGLIAAGVGCLTWAELSLRRGYSTTANAVSGAGIAVLYIAFFAGHSLYELFPLGLTFVLMSVVTVLAGVLAVRYDAFFTAVLGLLGGFATPLVLSTGVDRPLGLFSYILLLNVGLLAVALRKRWHGMVLLALAGTFVIEVGWFGRFMAPEKMWIGLTAFLVFGILYLLLPVLSREDEESPALLQAGAAGGTVPFLFALLLAGNPAYAAEWPLLFLFVGLLDAALLAVALFRKQVPLLIAGALATAVTLSLWAGQGLSRDVLWGPTLGAIALAALLNAASRLARLLAPERLEDSPALLEAAGLVATAGLGLYALVLVARGFGEPAGAFLTLLVALAALIVERTGERRITGVVVLAGLGLASLVQLWSFRHPAGDALLRNLAVGLLVTLGFSILAALRARAPLNAEEDEGAAVAANVVFVAGLFGCLASTDRGGTPFPLFLALGLAVVLAIVSALRRDWTPLVAAALAVSGSFALVWQESFFPADVGVVLPAYFVFFLGFLVLPFVVPESVRSTWRHRPLPWFTSALSGAVFFLPMHQAIVRVWGKGWIGALPVVLAAFTVAALAGVTRRFAAREEDAPGQALRLRYLALFAAIALGFVAVAIPLQLDRQWITIGWALEAAAVWWLYGRLPHRGLQAFGAVLFACVGTRLLLNIDVFRYQERGLPIVNWLLYTYGIPALCCFVGAAFLRKADPKTPLAPAAGGLGLLLVFWLINLEIFDYYSPGRHLVLTIQRHVERDLIMSVAWGLYALALLVIGIARGVRPLRFVSLGFLILTVGKVFLYDLSALTGIHRILSFLGLGISLILVSLIYQRFVLAREVEP